MLPCTYETRGGRASQSVHPDLVPVAVVDCSGSKGPGRVDGCALRQAQRMRRVGLGSTSIAVIRASDRGQAQKQGSQHGIGGLGSLVATSCKPAMGAAS